MPEFIALRRFKTRDGYVLILFKGAWVDAVDLHSRDMMFLDRGDLLGPVDHLNERIPGRIACCGRDTDWDGNCPIHKAPGKVRDRYRRRAFHREDGELIGYGTPDAIERLDLLGAEE
tara:strand:- start:3388 stop:3738 length:351 start_codon:yes stop_codon:yes gene_type:complete